ncbi:hypothetical protein ACOME3_009938 [Neoechinorhynchus agilis]
MLYFEASRYGSVICIHSSPSISSIIFKNEVEAIDALKGFSTIPMVGRNKPFEKVELLRKRVDKTLPVLKDMNNLEFFDPPSLYAEKATRTLFVGNIPAALTQDDIRKAYLAFGDIWLVDAKAQTGLAVS